MFGKVTVTTPPAVAPVSIDLVKSHCRIDDNDNDLLLPIYIGTATAMAETFLNRALLTQTLKYSLGESFPSNSWPLVPAPILILPIAMEWNFNHMLRKDIELPRSPVQSISAVSFALWGDTTDTVLDPTQYDTDLSCDPSRVRIHSDTSWNLSSHVSIEYVAGYGPTPASVPVPIIHAILLMVANLVEHRGDVDVGDLPEASRALLWPYRQLTFW